MVVLHIDRMVTLAQVRTDLIAQGPKAMIFYGPRSCWWTHRPEDLGRGKGIPTDPCGSPLFQTDNWQGFLAAVEANPAHYGRHGLEAFIAAHHRNCRDAASGAPWTTSRWEDINIALDALLIEESRLKRKH